MGNLDDGTFYDPDKDLLPYEESRMDKSDDKDPDVVSDNEVEAADDYLNPDPNTRERG